jgi:hypothetical protein
MNKLSLETSKHCIPLGFSLPDVGMGRTGGGTAFDFGFSGTDINGIALDGI